MEYAINTETEFARDVLEGLTATNKHLSSKYFYDQRGDVLFQKIMKLPEYYLTQKEFSILDQYKDAILQPFLSSGQPFNLVEMGAGDGLKTKILLRYLQDSGCNYTYYPIDISGTVLEQLKCDLKQDFPSMCITPITGTYKRALEEQKWEEGRRNLFLFLGANIGNFDRELAVNMLRRISEALNAGDYLLIGFDLKKDPEVILQAYNDPKGVTRDFNLNILSRINKELGGDFDLAKFKHWPMYDPLTGECRSYLISMETQKVTISGLDKEVYFEKAEPIHTEVSKKYNNYELGQLAEESGFVITRDFEDKEHFFTDSLWQKQ
ncbi:L-histidine N(alpha)-methyltransferase [Echinicola strongylocentroti]|uniref:L-histidine N(Alpha)-methyltransferase n=1 Tax=Echinicola strongylocentroti TaxID=1795355 RepID=A0A2Z4INP8_9BACT|nr:L-histidine N(alpha)-methyltransferase [Echinicola strongylocentroti]AWW32535.1 L-histidine N(alpha)-methyltransferase [Echinicola strongylocentroti]